MRRAEITHTAPVLPRRARHGLTLLELSIALVVLTLLMTMAAPSVSGWLARHRLRATAQHLAADLGEARAEAVRLTRPVHLVFHAGTNWCYALALSDQADCRASDAATLKVVRSSEHPGVTLLEAAPQAFDGRNGASLGRAGFAHWASQRGEQLTVRLSPMGRPSLCAPEAPVPGVSRC